MRADSQAAPARINGHTALEAPVPQDHRITAWNVEHDNPRPARFASIAVDLCAKLRQSLTGQVRNGQHALGDRLWLVRADAQAMTTGTRLGQHFTRAGIALRAGGGCSVIKRVEIVDVTGQAFRTCHDFARGQHAFDQAGGPVADIVTDLGAVDHSDAFLQVMKMLGNWDGKLYMTDGTVVDTNTSFNLTSNGNTIVETLVEDGVEMLTTYSDKDGELVIKHYCALGTEPMFVVDSLNDKSLNLISDSTPGYDPQQDNYVESMMWTLDASEPMNFRVDASINMDGQVNRQYSLFEKVE